MSQTDCVEIVHLIEKLTEEEGTILSIPSPNADFGGPAMFVTVSPGMSNVTQRFNGESLLDCLRKASKEPV